MVHLGAQIYSLRVLFSSLSQLYILLFVIYGVLLIYGLSHLVALVTNTLQLPCLYHHVSYVARLSFNVWDLVGDEDLMYI